MESEFTTVNYFKLFGLPEQFEIDVNLLNSRYLALQRLVHPDVYVTASASEYALASHKSAALNEALRIIKDPLARANYLLTLHGLSPNFHTATTSDAAFLMEQMQWREDLAAAQTLQDVTFIINKLQLQYELWMQILTTELNAEHWSAAQEMVYKLQFLSKLRRSAEELEIRFMEN